MTLQETTMEDRLALLERRLASLEDEREIVQLLTTYGALADSGSSAELAAIWTEDGVYDNDVISMTGRDQIFAMVESAAHQGYIARGCAHFNGPVSVHVDGDTAVAVSHSLMVLHEDGAFRINRATANHWQLRRTEEGWRATARVGRILDGNELAPLLLRTGALGQLPPDPAS
ncbi:nuclear transport factor 2 family protein [Nocardioides sp. NPDC057577]|uniref:nuclear transport factor 2 family protein n=1 Tax=Nocardioides sp. NPDC057577 TaxID=3346171 RepID=UPI0036735495